ncbi:hypothetical protein PPV_Vac110-(243-244)n1 [Avipoxvirus sp.]|uniref:Uncharacterized protein n=1 Tax=Fowlpox virus TaxID=10261 RepID=A0A891M1D3_FOWPV|nr:hypothetical protein [Fowlpox virus]UNS14495.1 ALPV-331 [Albatrosspox virus]UQT20793.1 hypothetical protein [Fowlpox virus]WPD90989.1 hypothetical protein PPV_Vac110-(243-244)n1 [Avipoxvirus sp.]
MIITLFLVVVSIRSSTTTSKHFLTFLAISSHSCFFITFTVIEICYHIIEFDISLSSYNHR